MSLASFCDKAHNVFAEDPMRAIAFDFQNGLSDSQSLGPLLCALIISQITARHKLNITCTHILFAIV